MWHLKYRRRGWYAARGRRLRAGSPPWPWSLRRAQEVGITLNADQNWATREDGVGIRHSTVRGTGSAQSEADVFLRPALDANNLPPPCNGTRAC